MDQATVNECSNTRDIYGVVRLDERGRPIEVIGTAPDLEAAADAARAMGPGHVAGTWSYWKN